MTHKYDDCLPDKLFNTKPKNRSTHTSSTPTHANRTNGESNIHTHFSRKFALMAAWMDMGLNVIMKIELL